MPLRSHNSRIALLAPFSHGNLGNAILQRVLIERISQVLPSAEFFGCYVDPAGKETPAVHPFPFHRNVITEQSGVIVPNSDAALETSPPSKRFKDFVKSIPVIRPMVQSLRSLAKRTKNLFYELRFLTRSHSLAKSFDLFIIGGGGQIDDAWGGPWALPYSLFTWALMAKLAGKPLLILSVGTESVTTGLGKWFFRKLFQYARSRSFRDVDSQTKAVALGSPEPNPIFPDLAFGIQASISTASAHPPSSALVIGLSPMSYGDPRSWPVQRQQSFELYCKTLCEFAAWLLRAGHQVVLFPTQTRMDKIVLQEIQDCIAGRIDAELLRSLNVAKLHTSSDLFAIVPSLDMVVASRFHGTLVPLRLGVPTIAISSESKVIELMRELELTEFQLDFEQLTLEDLQKRFSSLAAQLPQIKAQILQRVETITAKLEEQFCQIDRDYLTPISKTHSNPR